MYPMTDILKTDYNQSQIPEGEKTGRENLGLPKYWFRD